MSPPAPQVGKDRVGIDLPPEPVVKPIKPVIHAGDVDGLYKMINGAQMVLQTGIDNLMQETMRKVNALQLELDALKKREEEHLSSRQAHAVGDTLNGALLKHVKLDNPHDQYALLETAEKDYSKRGNLSLLHSGEWSPGELFEGWHTIGGWHGVAGYDTNMKFNSDAQAIMPQFDGMLCLQVSLIVSHKPARMDRAINMAVLHGDKVVSQRVAGTPEDATLTNVVLTLPVKVAKHEAYHIAIGDGDEYRKVQILGGSVQAYRL